MSDDKKNPDEGQQWNDTTAKWRFETKLYVLGCGGAEAWLDVNCRDINKIFAENPLLRGDYKIIFMMRFFDIPHTKVLVNGKEIEKDYPKEPTNFSPRLFLPGKGRIFTLNEVKDGEDKLSERLTKIMTSYSATAVFLDDVTGVLVPIEPEKGDHILDESEIYDFEEKTSPIEPSASSISIDEPEESLVEPEDVPDIKKLN